MTLPGLQTCRIRLQPCSTPAARVRCRPAAAQANDTVSFLWTSYQQGFAHHAYSILCRACRSHILDFTSRPMRVS